MRLLVLASILLKVGSVWGKWYQTHTEGNIVQELGVELSEDARIVLEGEESFEESAKRWQWWSRPGIKAVVEVASEADVEKTIRYANQHSIPFVAQTGGHGSTSALSNIRDGIQISLKKLNSIELSKEGTYATFGGGVKGGQVINTLWKSGKWAVTGACTCVSLLGVSLGGGHGVLQGYYGLPSDQILSIRLALANSSSITVSATSNPDLFWAIQGAGHNFGIVTSVDYLIYDNTGKETWSHEMFTFLASEENVRNVYIVVQKMMATQPRGFFNYGLITRNPFSEAGELIILHSVIYNGPLSSIRKYTEPLHSLIPVAVTTEEGDYRDVSRYLQTSDESLVCNVNDYTPGAGVLRLPVDIEDYDIEALVKAVKKFEEVVMSEEGEAVRASFFLVEQYSTHGVKERGEEGKTESSAVAFRDKRVLIAPVLYYTSFNVTTGEPNRELDELAVRKGLEIRQPLVDAAKDQGGYKTYVNYAYGGETLQEVYGDKTRTEKLKELKKKWDSKSRFSFYLPIKPEEKVHGEL